MMFKKNKGALYQQTRLVGDTISVKQSHRLHQTNHIVSEKRRQKPWHCIMTEMLQGAAIAD